MKKILITGANSYIGTSFERYIKENFADEYAVDTVDMIDGTWREKDFSEYDTVFHVAGIAHSDNGKISKEKEKLYYSNLGIFCCFFKIPYKKKDYYFCSQFVVEMLQLAGEIKLKKKASLYMPHQLLREIKKQFCVREVVYNPL